MKTLILPVCSILLGVGCSSSGGDDTSEPEFLLTQNPIQAPAADALAMRQAGADLVQLYTAFIYRGPSFVAELADTLS